MDIKAFRGLNNVSDPLRLGLGWLTQADNVNISESGALSKRDGYSLVSTGAYTGAYSTIDFSRMYVAVAGTIRDFVGNVIYTLTSTAPIYWCEVNDQVFFNNGTDNGIILPDNTVLVWAWPNPPPATVNAMGVVTSRSTYILPDGRETGTGDSDGAGSAPAGTRINVYTLENDVFTCPSGRDLLNAFLDPLPASSDVIQHWKGGMYAAMYMPAENQTVIWFSEPLAYHLFNLNSNFFMVPGHVRMLAPHADALIVGTGERVYAYDGTKIAQIAEYGVVPGQHWSKDDERILFWTTRGLCAALPFLNLTERQVSVAPGVRAGGTIVRDGGQKRYVVALQQGGSAFNSYV